MFALSWPAPLVDHGFGNQLALVRLGLDVLMSAGACASLTANEQAKL
jgi:hypothetical protein